MKIPGLLLVLTVCFILVCPVYAIDWELLIAPTGAAIGDWFGCSVSGAGDMNGDGYDDVIVGAQNNRTAGDAAGQAYVFFGGASMNNVADVTMTGEAINDNFGNSVSVMGDVNGDGYDDVIVGAYLATTADSGKAYIYYGGASMNNVADVTMTGAAAGECLGISVGGAGDVNGDGYDDVIVGAYLATTADSGKAYIYYGGASMNNVADVTMTGVAAGDYFGYSVSGADDVNGDSYDDVIVGAELNDAGGNDAGRAYVFYGSASMDNVADVTMTGAAAGDYFGYSVSEAGDANGDSYGDAIVGAHCNNAGGIDAGRAYVFFGGASMDNVADVTMTGVAVADNFGYSVSGAGDVNGDGFDDVIVGACLNNAGSVDAGRAYVFYGGSAMNNMADMTITGAAADDRLGNSVSGAGDVNGDGYDDVIVGAYGNDAGGSNAGRAYVYAPYLLKLLLPNGAETWNVGTMQNVLWKGTERADVYLSVDGGANYDYKIVGNAGGADSNFYSFRVPHTPSKFSRVMVVKTGASPAYPRNFDVSDSFFTIQSTITLLSFNAIPNQEGCVQLFWQTEPEVPDLQGYNLYCSNDGVSFEKINSDLITTNDYSDSETHGGLVTYQLGAVNGWNKEYIVGEVSLANVDKPLVIFPTVVKDKGTVIFDVMLRYETQVEISVYDISGKRVKTLVNDEYSPGYHAVQFDDRDERDGALPNGTYFIVMKTPEYSKQAKFIKLK